VNTAPKFVLQYQGELTIRNGAKVTYLPLISNDLEEAKEIVGRVLGTPTPEFTTDPSTNCTLVPHPSHQRGKNPIGWISELEIPETMSVKAERVAA
jgi:hypothetical protein